MPSRLPEVDYPAHYKLERAYSNGMISFQGSQWYLSNCLEGEVVGLEEIGDGRWRVNFAHIPMGILDVRNSQGRRGRRFGVLVRLDGEVTALGRKKHRRPL